jgi:uncharacterized membrane protein
VRHLVGLIRTVHYNLARSWRSSMNWFFLSRLIDRYAIPSRLIFLRRRQTRDPPAYQCLFGTWFAFGFPAFAAVLGILWLMITRPALSTFL